MVFLELMSAINGVFPTLQDSDALLCHIYLCSNNINKLEKNINDLSKGLIVRSVPDDSTEKTFGADTICCLNI